MIITAIIHRRQVRIPCTHVNDSDIDKPCSAAELSVNHGHSTEVVHLFVDSPPAVCWSREIIIPATSGRLKKKFLAPFSHYVSRLLRK